MNTTLHVTLLDQPEGTTEQELAVRVCDALTVAGFDFDSLLVRTPAEWEHDAAEAAADLARRGVR